MLCQPITRTPPTRILLHQNALFDQLLNVAQGRVLGAFGDLGPLRGGQFAGKAVQEFV